MVGRSAADADVAIAEDSELSSSHFELACDGDVCQIRDLESTNGTCVNGDRVQTATVKDGDEVSAGQSRFRISASKAAATTSSTPQQQKTPPLVTGGGMQPSGPSSSAAAAKIGGPSPQNWNFVNATPFEFTPVFGRLEYPKTSVTFVVKGTFDLIAGEPLSLAEEQLPPSGDQPYPDDEQMAGGCRYESDFAHYKPRADVLVVGHCHTPNGVEANQCEVGFTCGDLSKSLLVHGDRVWEGLTKSRATPPEPFSQLELRYEHSFGGSKVPGNPIGKGHQTEVNEAGQTVHPLPNIESPTSRLVQSTDRPKPAGLGPLGQYWEDRSRKVGTYDAAWQTERWPWFPRDLDWGYFNAAPIDQQIEYPRGDEQLRFVNLHPEHAELQSRLPGIRVRCFVERNAVQASPPASPQVGDLPFDEVSMVLDTVWIDTDNAQAVLVWRGATEVPSVRDCGINIVYFATESTSAKPSSLSENREALAGILAARDADEVDPKEEELQQAFQEREAKVDRQSEALDAEHAQQSDSAEATAPDQTAQLAAAGVDPAQLAASDNPASVNASAVSLNAGMADLRKTDPEQADRLGDLELGEFAQMETELEQDKAEFEQESRGVTREQVETRLAEGGSFSGENLAGVDFSRLDLTGQDFSESDLSRANLLGCKLVQANLTGAELRAQIYRTRIWTERFSIRPTSPMHRCWMPS